MTALASPPIEAAEESPPQPGSLWSRAGGWYGICLAFLLVSSLRVVQLAVVLWMGDERQTPLKERLLIWDGGWFINVATEGYPPGYSYIDGEITGNGFAFFPAFPMLIRAVSTLGFTPQTASLIVAGVAGLAAGILIFLLGVSLSSRRMGYLLLVLVCAQPMSIVLSMGYTEPVFLALVAGALLAARERVWWAAGLAGIGAALTRPTGAAVAVALAVATVMLWWGARRGRLTLRRRELAFAGTVSALALLAAPAFLAWVGLRVGEWDAWFTVQTAGWGSTFDFGSSVGAFIADTVRSGDGVVENTTVWLIIGAIGLCAVAVADRVWPPLLVYGMIALIMAVGQAGYWHSKPRLLVPVLLLACVPVAQALAKASPRTAGVVVTLWAAFGLWFGAHMITVWPFTI